ncbi:MAG: pyruvate:ferredoxin (flavodoxin) oxidoreductase [Clostridiales bacterium]|jgi:pyruvate-ferredoxin/flavodoxin oxidoreductase|nr:pyruvate:ferredoxin (flavodoxin) oxidoreductase [Clostridiales bacterium]
MSKKMKTMDGNKAASYVSYAFTEVAAIFPITPSSNMAENVDEWTAGGKIFEDLPARNIFGQPVHVVEMQSEAGAAGAMHGSLGAGALTTSYTASQGLLLMIPNMYKIAGELLPGVLHVSARAVAAHALSIFGDHSDVMSCNQTGFAMLASGSVQEVMDLGGVAHLAAIKTRIPFLHFFDGFRTSHEQQKIEIIDYADFAKLLDWEALQKFRDQALNPEHPVVRGTNQNPDIFFQAREACNPFFAQVPEAVAAYLEEISKLTGRNYQLFDYYGAPDAEHVLVIMGSATETAMQAVDYLNSQGQKTGLIKVRLYRPFAKEYFLKVLPETVKRIAVLDRIKTPGAPGEPLFLDVLSAFYGRTNPPLIIGGRYGLGSKDTIPADMVAALENLMTEKPKSDFTLSINDDVTHTSLSRGRVIDLLPAGTIQCKFFGLGSDGTVGANKQAIDIIGKYTEMYAQAYFSYDSKKSGGFTVSHLRFGNEPIKAPYLISNADFISCSNQAYIHKYDLLAGLKPGGAFLLNSVWGAEELADNLPAAFKNHLARNNIKFYIVNAVKIAKELGLGQRINMVMQAAFFKITEVIPLETAVAGLNDSIEIAYGNKGEKVVNMNKQAVQKGLDSLVEVPIPPGWSNAGDSAAETGDEPEFVSKILKPMACAKGDELPVSAFSGREDGHFPLSGTMHEKRGVASFVPRWLPDNCIQCNQCSYVCPHATIRPYLLTDAQVAAAPDGLPSQKAKGKDFAGQHFSLQVSPLDCQGCGVCVVVCPAKQKALEMHPIGEEKAAQANWDYVYALPERHYDLPAGNIKNSQFKKPLFEFSGACAGCGETPYAKLISQVYGDRMMIANATGCSSIWGAAVPAMPFTVNHEGKGPAWCNSLFEDNAEFAFGMLLGEKARRNRLAEKIAALQKEAGPDLAAACREWLDSFSDGEASKQATAKLLPLLVNSSNPLAKAVLVDKDQLIKKSFWAFGGDGWAYDIGYGGLDHVLASGEDVNIFVYDTEVYSNTGGQSSKSTPTAAIAKFAASGKRVKKKDLGMMAISYGYVYVAQIAMGADMNQTLKAIKEAEAYPGPSLIIAYSTCINHGLKSGMSHTMTEMKAAVESGYWHLYRFDPQLKEAGKNPFILDSKAPTKPFREFIENEVRFNSLKLQHPEVAEILFAKTEQDARERYESYLMLANR